MNYDNNKIIWEIFEGPQDAQNLLVNFPFVCVCGGGVCIRPSLTRVCERSLGLVQAIYI